MSSSERPSNYVCLKIIKETSMKIIVFCDVINAYSAD